MNLHKAFSYLVLSLMIYTSLSGIVYGNCESLIRRVAKKIGISIKPNPLQEQNIKFNKNLNNFMKTYPEHVEIIKNVRLDFHEYNLLDYRGKINGKDIVVISTYGLDLDQRKALKNDYIKNFTDNMISFTGVGHLHTRIKDKVYDYRFDSFHTNNYQLARHDRYEPFILLSNEEYTALEIYIQNIERDFRSTIGVSHDTDRPDRLGPNANLESNRPIKGTHNCTSWVCSAPIGSNFLTLSNLLESPREIARVADLMAWLSQQVGPHRSPFSFYWTDQPLGKRLEDYLRSDELDILDLKSDPHDEMFNKYRGLNDWKKNLM